MGHFGQTFFPAYLLASTEETKPNTTKAHPEHKNTTTKNKHKNPSQVWSPYMSSSLELEQALLYSCWTHTGRLTIERRDAILYKISNTGSPPLNDIGKMSAITSC